MKEGIKAKTEHKKIEGVKLKKYNVIIREIYETIESIYAETENSAIDIAMTVYAANGACISKKDCQNVEFIIQE